MADEQPMTPEQWDEASTREGLIAQLRGQRGAGRMIMAELRECREENERLRAMLEARHATIGALAYALEGLMKDGGLTHEERIEMANRWLIASLPVEEVDDG